jgi:uncharacterized protein (TIGR00725 family)
VEGRIERFPIVGVMGSGNEAHESRARAVGRWLATQRVHLLTGGGLGVMESVSRAFASVRGRRGLIIGVVPGEPTASGYQARAGYPNRWVEVPIFTHLSPSAEHGAEARSRNPINVLSSNVIVALPGGAGTASEVRLALRYGKPLIAFLARRQEIPDLPDAVRVEDDLARIVEFVGSALAARRR